MGRPSKNPNHPLTRLRRTLSTPNHEMTRKDLSKRAGIPEASIKDIETGVYKMTPEVAMRVSLATGVDPQSLMRGDDHLLDVAGLPFTRVSKKQVLGWSEELTESIFLLFQTILSAAKEKIAIRQFHFLFDAWISQVVPALGMAKEVFEQLNKIGDRLDPDFSIPDSLLPREVKAKQLWFESRQKLQDELEAEISLVVYEALQADKEFQRLSASEQEAFAPSGKMWIENPAEFRRVRAEQEQRGKKMEQKLREKMLADIESATEDQKIDFSTAISGLAELGRQTRERYRRRALERIAARKSQA
jgi:plasmid maintenance system antidote protein VapI